MSTISLEQALVLAGREDLVKAASSLTEEYTFDSKDTTFLSFIRAHVSDPGPTVKQACVDHARFWGISTDCETAISKVAEWKPKSLSDDDFALVIDGGTPKYAAYDAPSTFDSAIAFHEQRHLYPLQLRKAAASRLIAKADQFGVTLPEYVATYLYKAAGLAMPTSESISNTLVQRLNETPETFAAEKMKLASLLNRFIDQRELRRNDQLVKSAVETLERFDVTCGLQTKYGSSVDLPEEMLSSQLTFDKFEKCAGVSKLAVTLVNGKRVDITKLSKQALAAVDPALTRMDLDQLAEVLPTLPRGDADLLVRLD